MCVCFVSIPLSFVVAINLKICWVHSHLPLAVCLNSRFHSRILGLSTCSQYCGYYPAIRFAFLSCLQFGRLVCALWASVSNIDRFCWRRAVLRAFPKLCGAAWCGRFCRANDRKSTYPHTLTHTHTLICVAHVYR